MKIQSIVFPSVEEKYHKEMFYRGRTLYNHEQGKLYLQDNEIVSFDTFFNSVQLKIWRQECGIHDLFLYLNGNGKIKVRFYLKTQAGITEILGENTIDLCGELKGICIPRWNALSTGILFFTITALGAAYICGGYFWTSQKPLLKAKLGLVITHFNRQKFVIPAAKRLTREILIDKDYKSVSLVIVDNSQNLDKDDFDDCVIIIKNKNTGGSGGFARGLMYLKDSGFTHCIFMDDDASCLSESIKRSYAFFSFYCGKEKVGLSGILLEDKKTNLVYESCGRWRKVDAKSLNYGLNLLTKDGLDKLDEDYKTKGYGAWCYFGFRISDIKYWPFPFFVRGDDILFSLQNEFSIINIFGVSTLIDSFANKENATTFYLTLRSHLVISIWMKTSTIWQWWRRFVRCNRAPIACGFYSWSYGAERALEDILSPSYCFKKDIEGKIFREKNKEYCCKEVVRNNMTGIEFLKNVDGRKKETLSHYFLRKITFNGLFWPVVFMRSSSTFYKREGIDGRLACGIREINWFNDDNQKIEVTSFNRREVICGICRNWKSLILLIKWYSRARKKINEELMSCTTEQFWRQVFGLNK